MPPPLDAAPTLLGGLGTPRQAALVLASAVVFQLLSQPSVVRRCMGGWREFRERYPSLSAKDRRDFEISFASMAHAALASLVSLSVVAFPDETIGIGDAAKLFGFSPRAQAMFGVTTGFFVWDLFTILTDPTQFDWPFLVHAVVCLSVYVLGQYPIFHYYGSAFLLFELSTPALNLRKMLLALGRKGTPLFVLTERTFGLLFLSARILFGLPISYLFLRDVRMLLSHPEIPHHRRALSFFILANLSMCTLNLYWFWGMLKKFLRPKAGGKKSQGQGQSAEHASANGSNGADVGAVGAVPVMKKVE